MKIITPIFFALTLLLSSTIYAQINKTVAQDGSGDYTTVQAAITAAPSNSTTPWVIFIKNGKYKEKITVASNKTFIQLIGESVANVILYYDDYAGLPVGLGTLGTQNSASITISGNDFTAENITFANTFNFDSAVAAGVAGTQAVAMTIGADRTAFKNCRFQGNQDTLYTKGSGTPRHYFKSCYIDGIVDFIFGSSIDVFDSCIIYPKSRTSSGTSYITAANTTVGQAFGYVFRDCRLMANTGNTSYFLGRPWGNAAAGVTANNKVAFINCTLPNTILPAGWSVWDAGTNTAVINDAEYKSKKTDGSLTDISQRVNWSLQLADTTGYNLNNIFSGWDPCTTRADFCPYTAPELVVSNFTGKKAGANSNFTWNISWPVTGVTYTLYRSIDNKLSYNNIGNTISANDTSINFSLIDAVPPAGSVYYYFIQASKAGFVSSSTDTIPISSAPTITTTVTSLGGFLQGVGLPSANQAYILSAVNLVGNVTVTPPANFEVSTDATTWYTNANPLNITQVASAVPNTTIYCRLNASIAGPYSGNIVHSTTGTGATNKNVAVTGTTQSTPIITYIPLQQWNLTVDNNDDPAVRAVGLTATVPTLNRLYPSNGTQVAAVPAHSAIYGQALSATSGGDGLWSVAGGGPGSSLNRTFYEQFTISPAVGYTVTVDSLLVTAGFYGSTSGTKFGVMYSKSGFVSDSATVSGGIDGSGVSLPGSANAGFTTPFVFTASATSGPNNLLGLALNGSTGVNILPGQSLSIRIYYSCGSTSAGRYAVLKNVIAKGVLPVLVPLKLVSFKAKSNDNTVALNWITENEINTSKFAIERSVDGKAFAAIAELESKGSGEYRFTDNHLPSTVNHEPLTVYYRLKMIDKDGSFTYSNIEKIAFNTLHSTFNIYPNPVSSLLTVFHTAIELNDRLQVVNNEGKIIQTIQPVKGSTQTAVHVASLAKGNYMISLVGKQRNETIQFIKE